VCRDKGSNPFGLALRIVEEALVADDANAATGQGGEVIENATVGGLPLCCGNFREWSALKLLPTADQQ
jgi:hypothetical protein